ncbi:MAG: YciI family protein, partial [Vicinamibacterales bacterium]
LKSAGQWVSAEGLVSPDEARLVVANDDGSPSVTDGPFAETKEFIAGYWIIDAKDADEAYRFAARVSACPGPGGKPLNMPVEVRAVSSAPPAD